MALNWAIYPNLCHEFQCFKNIRVHGLAMSGKIKQAKEKFIFVNKI